ncbi:MAG: acyltransferase domain-containing protein [Defluviitaleaceae bacterium]|nr:acyltransferase domain-containing protein [Defluviitaleaceae bacterium]
MKRYALVFSGQGSERVGMFNDLLKEPNVLEQVLEELKSHLGMDIYSAVTTRDSAVVAANNQILLSVFHYLKAKLIVEKIGHEPAICMGHSFGQFSALANSGAISFVEMAGFLGERMRIINDPSIDIRASFKSIHGMTLDAFEGFRQAEGLCGNVELALHNQKEQIVCAATKNGQDRLGELAGKYGYVLKDINVSRPYHTVFMEEYNRMLLPYIDRLGFSRPLCPVLLNHYKAATVDEDVLREEAKIQMIKPVFWYDGVINAAESVDVFVVIDPSETQLKIIRRITDKKVHNVSNMNAVKMIEKKGL